MTGAEIVPAAINAGAKLSERVQSEYSADSQAVREAAKESTELTEAGKIRAKRLALREQALLVLWKPLARFFGVSKDYFEFEFPGELAQKLEDVPEDELVTPKASVVAPAMEALGYSLDEPGLKEMYLNLLAGASTRSKGSLIHPSFVDTVRQLSSEEAPVLDFVLKSGRLTAVRIKRIRTSNGSYEILAPCLIDIYIGSTGKALQLPQLGSWVTNWVRLGLVELTFTESLVVVEGDADLYSWVQSRPEYVAMQAAEPAPPEGTQPLWRIDFDRGQIRATPRGNDFYRAASSPT